MKMVISTRTVWFGTTVNGCRFAWMRSAARSSAGRSCTAENVSAGRQRGAIVSRLVCSQPRDLSFPVLTQDDQWILGISFGRRLRHVIRFNRPDHDNLQMPLHETLRRGFNGCSAGQH